MLNPIVVWGRKQRKKTVRLYRQDTEKANTSHSKHPRAQPAARTHISICDPPSSKETAATSQAGHHAVLIFAPAKGFWSTNDERLRKYYVRKVCWGGRKKGNIFAISEPQTLITLHAGWSERVFFIQWPQSLRCVQQLSTLNGEPNNHNLSFLLQPACWEKSC